MKKKNLLILILLVFSTFFMFGCGKKEVIEEEVVEQGEIKLNEEYVISQVSESVNKYLNLPSSYIITTYKDELKSENLYRCIFYNRKDNYIVYDNSYNNNTIDYYAERHYWNDGNAWYFDLKEIPDFSVKNHIDPIENDYEKKLLENTIINEQECYSLEVKITKSNKDVKTITYYVTVIDNKFLGIKQDNLYSLLELELKEIEPIENFTFKESTH